MNAGESFRWFEAFDRAIRSSMLAVWREYRDVLEGMSITLEQWPVVFLAFTQECSPHEAVDFLALTTADAQRVFDETIQQGLIVVSEDGRRVEPGADARDAFARLVPEAMRLNEVWRSRLVRTFQQENLDIFLRVLQSGVPSTVSTDGSDGTSPE